MKIRMYTCINYSEEVVKGVLTNLLNEYENICKCDRCLADMAALALNKVKPRYVVTEEGMIYAKSLLEVDKQEKISIMAIVINAIEEVAKNPKH